MNAGFFQFEKAFVPPLVPPTALCALSHAAITTRLPFSPGGLLTASSLPGASPPLHAARMIARSTVLLSIIQRIEQVAGQGVHAAGAKLPAAVCASPPMTARVAASRTDVGGGLDKVQQTGTSRRYRQHRPRPSPHHACWVFTQYENSDTTFTSR